MQFLLLAAFLFTGFLSSAEPLKMGCYYRGDSNNGIELEEVAPNRMKASYIVDGRPLDPVMAEFSITPAPAKTEKDEVFINVNNVLIRAYFDRQSLQGEGVLIKAIINGKEMEVPIDCNRNQTPAILFGKPPAPSKRGCEDEI